MTPINLEKRKYLESGIKFISIAKHSKNYSRKSEYYYKGALLLYRGGQREEAINAFKEASNDNNNFFSKPSKRTISSTSTMRRTQ